MIEMNGWFIRIINTFSDHKPHFNQLNELNACHKLCFSIAYLWPINSLTTFQIIIRMKSIFILLLVVIFWVYFYHIFPLKYQICFVVFFLCNIHMASLALGIHIFLICVLIFFFLSILSTIINTRFIVCVAI